MYLENVQKYNEFVYVCQEDTSLKDTLLNKMHLSLRAIANIKNNYDKISINGKSVAKNNLVKKGDIIKISLAQEESNYQTQHTNLNILYEDDDLLIIDKPAFMVVHPTKSHLTDTLLNYVQGIFEQKNIKSKVRFVSRLDKDTSGIITIAKNPYAHYILSQGYLSSSVKKYYTAIVKNHMKSEKGIIDKKIEKSNDGIKRVVSDTGVESITHYEVLENYSNFAILRLLLETGRTHQIRVHLSDMGNCIIGDSLYDEQSDIISRQALHCSKLELTVPRTMKKIIVESKLPYDMQEAIKILNSLNSN